MAFQHVYLHQHVYTDNYRHLDLAIRDLRGLVTQELVRFKLFIASTTCGLEFRIMGSWPIMFDSWPSNSVDQHGKLFRIKTDTCFEVKNLTIRDRFLISDIAHSLSLALKQINQNLRDENEYKLFCNCADKVRAHIDNSFSLNKKNVVLEKI